jgi:hypothetical protein
MNQRQLGRLIGAILGVLISIGIFAWKSMRSPGPDEEAARIDARSGRIARSVEGESAGAAGGARSGRGADAVGDGGVGSGSTGAGPAARPVLPTPSGPVEADRTAPPIEVPRSAEASERSAGWRLGQTRALIEVAQSRVTRLREVLAQLEQRGDAAAVERQRAVVERFDTRLSELRADLTDLETEARRDGTLGEAEAGYRESQTDEAARPPARETASGAIVR